MFLDIPYGPSKTIIIIDNSFKIDAITGDNITNGKK
jgi:hypothetical protein